MDATTKLFSLMKTNMLLLRVEFIRTNNEHECDGNCLYKRYWSELLLLYAVIRMASVCLYLRTVLTHSLIHLPHFSITHSYLLIVCLLSFARSCMVFIYFATTFSLSFTIIQTKHSIYRVHVCLCIYIYQRLFSFITPTFF